MTPFLAFTVTEPGASVTFVTVLREFFGLVLGEVDHLEKLTSFPPRSSMLLSQAQNDTWNGLSIEYVAPKGVESKFIDTFNRESHHSTCRA